MHQNNKSGHSLFPFHNTHMNARTHKHPHNSSFYLTLFLSILFLSVIIVVVEHARTNSIYITCSVSLYLSFCPLLSLFLSLFLSLCLSLCMSVYLCLSQALTLSRKRKENGRERFGKKTREKLFSHKFLQNFVSEKKEKEK